MLPIFDMHADVFMDLVRRHEARNAKTAGNFTIAYNAKERGRRPHRHVPRRQGHAARYPRRLLPSRHAIPYFREGSLRQRSQPLRRGNAAIADAGGLIGCMTSPAALAPLADRAHHSLERYMQHLTHMISAAGVDHVGLGLHFCEYLYTREEYPLISGLEDASRAQAIVQSLISAGYSESEVEKIAWRNFARVFEEAVR